jgi:hypothetical protein
VTTFLAEGETLLMLPIKKNAEWGFSESLMVQSGRHLGP